MYNEQIYRKYSILIGYFFIGAFCSQIPGITIETGLDGKSLLITAFYRILSIILVFEILLSFHKMLSGKIFKIKKNDYILLIMAAAGIMNRLKKHKSFLEKISNLPRYLAVYRSFYYRRYNLLLSGKLLQ
ncbi:MAG: hypothetical protein A2096_16365 [Spirochaetes bacterium GWF1_41_5]|nr:MAG: hypothetical protein A2096_16365 [Spirochaetes bacterium GWF1_41_5]